MNGYTCMSAPQSKNAVCAVHCAFWITHRTFFCLGWKISEEISSDQKLFRNWEYLLIYVRCVHMVQPLSGTVGVQPIFLWGRPTIGAYTWTNYMQSFLLTLLSFSFQILLDKHLQDEQ